MKAVNSTTKRDISDIDNLLSRLGSFKENPDIEAIDDMDAFANSTGNKQLIVIAGKFNILRNVLIKGPLRKNTKLEFIRLLKEFEKAILIYKELTTADNSGSIPGRAEEIAENTIGFRLTLVSTQFGGDTSHYDEISPLEEVSDYEYPGTEVVEVFEGGPLDYKGLNLSIEGNHDVESFTGEERVVFDGRDHKTGPEVLRDPVGRISRWFKGALAALLVGSVTTSFLHKIYPDNQDLPETTEIGIQPVQPLVAEPQSLKAIVDPINHQTVVFEEANQVLNIADDMKAGRTLREYLIDKYGEDALGTFSRNNILQALMSAYGNHPELFDSFVDTERVEKHLALPEVKRNALVKDVFGEDIVVDWENLKKIIDGTAVLPLTNMQLLVDMGYVEGDVASVIDPQLVVLSLFWKSKNSEGKSVDLIYDKIAKELGLKAQYNPRQQKVQPEPSSDGSFAADLALMESGGDINSDINIFTSSEDIDGLAVSGSVVSSEIDPSDTSVQPLTFDGRIDAKSYVKKYAQSLIDQSRSPIYEALNKEDNECFGKPFSINTLAAAIKKAPAGTVQITTIFGNTFSLSTDGKGSESNKEAAAFARALASRGLLAGFHLEDVEIQPVYRSIPEKDPKTEEEGLDSMADLPEATALIELANNEDPSDLVEPVALELRRAIMADLI